MECVVDASVVLAWVFPDERAGAASAFLDRLKSDDILWVPPLWWHEMANAVVMACRRGRMQEAEASGLLLSCGRLPIRMDSPTGADLAWRQFSIAREYGLSAYDAAYLDLAERSGFPLATIDQTLAAAAKKAGVKLVLG